MILHISLIVILQELKYFTILNTICIVLSTIFYGHITIIYSIYIFQQMMLKLKKVISVYFLFSSMISCFFKVPFLSIQVNQIIKLKLLTIYFSCKRLFPKVPYILWCPIFQGALFSKVPYFLRCPIFLVPNILVPHFLGCPIF